MNKMLVLAKAVEGRVEDLIRWYDTQHIADLCAVPGVVKAERHSIMPLGAPAGSANWDVLLIYEFDGDPMPILREMGARRGTDQMIWTDALDSTQTLSMVGILEPASPVG